MKCLTKKALWPHDEKCWSALFKFCRDHGRTLSRPVVKVHANTDFQGGLIDQLTEMRTTERCSAGFLFGEGFALRQTASNDSFWEIIQGYLEEEMVVLEIRSWDDLAGTSFDSALAGAIKDAKAAYRAKMDAFLASLPEPEPKPEPEKVPKWKKLLDTDSALIDWSDYDEDDDWDEDDSYFG